MTLLTLTLQYAISGMTAGSIYAIVGICWTVVYLIAQVLNFTTGEFVMPGGMLAWVFIGAGFGLVSAGILATACTVGIAMILERFIVRPIRYPSEMVYMMMTIASASVIKGIFLIGFGSETRTIEPFYCGEAHPGFESLLDSSGPLCNRVTPPGGHRIISFYESNRFWQGVESVRHEPQRSPFDRNQHQSVQAVLLWTFGWAGRPCRNRHHAYYFYRL